MLIGLYNDVVDERNKKVYVHNSEYMASARFFRWKIIIIKTKSNCEGHTDYLEKQDKEGEEYHGNKKWGN